MNQAASGAANQAANQTFAAERRRTTVPEVTAVASHEGSPALGTGTSRSLAADVAPFSRSRVEPAVDSVLADVILPTTIPTGPVADHTPAEVGVNPGVRSSLLPFPDAKIYRAA
jgi:hypothetical protein